MQDAQERTHRVVAAVEERAGRGGGQDPLELVRRRRCREHDVALVEVAAEPRRPALEPGERLPAGELLEEVLDQVLLGQALDQLDLLERDRGLVGHGAREVDLGGAGGGEEAEQLVIRHERHGHRRGSAAAGELGPELREANLGTRVAGRGRGGAQVQHLGRRIEQVDVAGLGAQELSRARGDRGKHGAERLGAGQELAELGQVLELVHPAAHLLVEARVLDRPGDERSARDEHLDLVFRELVRRLGVARDDADDVAVLAHDRHGDERLEALLLQLGDVLDARIVEELVADPGRLFVLGGPPGEALAALERDPPDEVRVGLRGGLEHEPVLLDEVHEAGVDRGGVRQEAHDRAEDLLQVQGRADRGDDRVQEPVLTGMCARRADERIVRRNRRTVTAYWARGLPGRSPLASSTRVTGAARTPGHASAPRGE